MLLVWRNTHTHMTPHQRSLETSDILQRLKRIEQAVQASRLRDGARTAGAIGTGTSLTDLKRRIKHIEQAMKVSRLRDAARNAGAIGEGTSVADLKRRVELMKASTSGNVTRRSKARSQRLRMATNVTGRSRARTRGLNSRTQ